MGSVPMWPVYLQASQNTHAVMSEVTLSIKETMKPFPYYTANSRAPYLQVAQMGMVIWSYASQMWNKTLLP
ncbi:hypothetical protein DPMN_056855 [Dreissena polymorpha]|uniref:Uncharacterized protein n=1 Tax=Dreissena polymorpha TaxID=45954 RepID=A0A9D4HTW1_DREPO|nr:hypothetical protein DPMN_056855 [Dreissena polymorpha]